MGDCGLGGRKASDSTVFSQLSGRVDEIKRRLRSIGSPDYAHVSTSHAERLNLSIRMGNRRFTRLTNAHSKKAENHEHSFALFAMHHNFCNFHSGIRCTPAMAAGVSNHVWELSEVISLLDKQDAKAA